jgi:hypothetical protein
MGQEQGSAGRPERFGRWVAVLAVLVIVWTVLVLTVPTPLADPPADAAEAVWVWTRIGLLVLTGLTLPAAITRVFPPRLRSYAIRAAWIAMIFLTGMVLVLAFRAG